MADAIPLEQTEEIETLASIYEGDENFKQISGNSFQYKVFSPYIWEVNKEIILFYCFSMVTMELTNRLP